MSYQFDNLDEHPIIRACGHQFEEDGSECEIVLRILPCQFTDHIHGCRLDSCNEKYRTQSGSPPMLYAK